MTNMV